MSDDLILGRNIRSPVQEVGVEYSRSSGPGGQHVNRTETRVTLRFPLLSSPSIPDRDRQRMAHRLRARLTKSGELLVSCERHRDRRRNQEEALERLQQLLRAAWFVPPARKKTRPTRASVERRLKQKKARAQSKRRRGKPSIDD